LNLRPEAEGGSERDGREEVTGGAAVAGGDAPPVLEPAEHALDEVAAFGGGLVEGIGLRQVAVEGMRAWVRRAFSQVLRLSAS
jgi:hypothetical protein